VRSEGHHRLKVEAGLGGLRLDVGVTLVAPWTVVFGPSGGGKSSLLRAMCGVLGVGSVEFARRVGREWIELAGVAVERRRIAYAPQGAAVFPHLSVRENVGFAAGSSLGTVEAAMEMFGLGALAGRSVRGLSGGERQRVSLARAFAVPRAELMLLDELFTGVGRDAREVLLGRMREVMAERGVPVIFVTHDVEEALLLGAEVVRLEEGRVVAQGAAAEVLAVERERMLAVLGEHTPGAKAPSLSRSYETQG
jgi:molybdate transport system ATP-binding protein